MTYDFDWSAGSIAELFDSGVSYFQSSEITVLKYDLTLGVVLGLTKEGKAFFAFRQHGFAAGFKTSRAQLRVMQSLNLGEIGVIEPAIALDFDFQSEDEIQAIATIFSGLYQFNHDFPGLDNATNAAQGFEDLIASLPKIGLSREIEIGLFGELSYIYSCQNKDDALRSWHSIPNATYDFSAEGSRLEVKTSTRPTRRHWLRSTQSLSDSEPGLFYLSIYAPEDSSGLTVMDLINLIRSEISVESQNLFSEYLSPFKLDEVKLKFDLDSAMRSFKFIKGIDVPVPISSDKNILEIRWRCDFLALPEYKKQCHWN